MQNISENYHQLLEQTKNSNVEIIAVSKYASNTEIIEAYECGIRNFAESYSQDATKRIDELSYLKDIRWHFIGRLQTNKVKNITGNFHLIHSVDSVKLIETINKESKKKGITQNVLLQVNVINDTTKAGFSKKEVLNNFQEITFLENIKVIGLMTIAPNTLDTNIIKESFCGLNELKTTINKMFSGNLTELSMGMTNDYQIALECGSTMIRVGKGIFRGVQI